MVIATAVSGALVVAFGFFLIGLAAAIWLVPHHAEKFLRGFASSALTHYVEQGLRLVVGAAFVVFASSMRHSSLFEAFGWIILGSTAVLLLIPWQWHQRFAGAVMPPVFRGLWLFAFGAFALGAFVLYSTVSGPASAAT